MRTTLLLASTYRALLGERDGLYTFMFHSVLPDDTNGHHEGIIDSVRAVRVKDFDRFVRYLVDREFQFVSVDDLIRGNLPSGKCALITFDDGYWNNTLVLPVVERYRTPLTIFVSTENVRKNLAFWWDTLYRAMRKRSKSVNEYRRIVQALIDQQRSHRDASLMKLLGDESPAPISDIDRPLTPDELKDLSDHPLVTIGNHSMYHTKFTLENLDELRSELETAQQTLVELTGKTPICVSYPYGDTNDTVTETVRQLGFQLGFATLSNRTSLPVVPGSKEALTLGRFEILAEPSVIEQCVKLTSGIWPLLRRIDRRLDRFRTGTELDGRSLKTE